jgi:hypothetical protein
LLLQHSLFLQHSTPRSASDKFFVSRFSRLGK